MAKIFYSVEDNTAPVIRITCIRRETPIDLSGATVDLLIYDKGRKSITNTGHQGCSIVDSVNGIIEYAIETGDVDASGKYKADVRITYPDTKVETLWERLDISVRKKIQ